MAVAWQVYSITHRALDLGYTGLALFLPGLLFLLPAGHVADRFDRRQIILLLLQPAGAVHGHAAGADAHGAALGAADLCGAVPGGDGAGVFRAGELGADPPPGPGETLCQRGHVGRGDFPVCQHRGAGAGRIAVYAAAYALDSRHAAGRRGDCVCIHAGHAGVVPGAGGQPAACGPGAWSTARHRCKVVLAGFRYVFHMPHAAGVVFAGPVCGAAGRRGGADAHLCAGNSAHRARAGWECCAPRRRWARCALRW